MTLRAVLIALAFIPVNVYLVVQWETVWGTQYPTTMGIFFNAIFSLLVVVGINAALRSVWRKGALSQQELITIYAMLMMGITVSGHDFSQSLFCTLATSHWFATPENEWRTLFWRYIPRWLTVNDDRVLHGFFEGESSLYVLQHIKGWLKPMVWWSIFLTVMVFTMLCMTVIVRKQWIETEKLTYPLVHLHFK